MQTKDKEFEKKKSLKNFLKNLQIFLEPQKRHYMSQGCVTMSLFKRKFALKKRD